MTCIGIADTYVVIFGPDFGLSREHIGSGLGLYGRKTRRIGSGMAAYHSLLLCYIKTDMKQHLSL